MIEFSLPKPALIAGTVVILASCGGGSGSSGSTSSPPPPPANSSPVINGPTSFSFEEGEVVSILINASDADGDTLRGRILDGADSGLFYQSRDLETSARKLFDFENPEDTDKNSVYEVDVEVSDGRLETTVRYTVTVTNRPGRGYLDENGAMAILGAQERDASGRVLAIVDDIDGDNLSEVIIGAPRRRVTIDGAAYFNGAAYLVSGSAIADSQTGYVDLDGDSAGKFIEMDWIKEEADFPEVGGAVTGLGDLDGDSIPEVAVSSFRWENGVTFVIRGSALRAALASGENISFPSLLADNDGLRLDGSSSNDASGFKISSVPDMDGDVLDELLICTPNNSSNSDPRFRSTTYLLFGSTLASGFGNALDLETIADANGAVRLNGTDYLDSDCSSTDYVDDFNDDGIIDIIIGESRGGTASSSRAHIVSGAAILAARTGGESIRLEDLEAKGAGLTLFSEVNLDDLGSAVSSAGDFNGDGIRDILVGAPDRGLQNDGSGEVTGAAYVIFGSASSFAGPLDPDELVRTGAGLEIVGASERERVGNAVDAAGDINGDGYDDILITARRAGVMRGDDIYHDTGITYLVLGQPDVPGNRIRLSEPFDGVTILGVNGDSETGSYIAGNGDFDNDGLPDIAIGADSGDRCFVGNDEKVINTGWTIVVTAEKLNASLQGSGTLDLFELLPHLGLDGLGTCDKPGLTWFRKP